MARRKRNLTLLSVLLLLVAAELGFRRFRAPVACVQIVNQGGEPIKDVRIASGSDVATVTAIAPGATAKVFLSGRGENPLSLNFQQKGNPLTSLEIPVFNPAELQREGFRLVLVIRPNEYERYQDDGEPSLFGRLAGQAQDWLERMLDSP